MKYSELIEKKRHGTPDFPVEYYHVDKSHPRYVMAAHWHKEFEIIRVISGSLTVFLNSKKHELAGGDCLFVEGGCLMRAYPDSCIYECLVFDTAMLDSRLIGSADVEYENFINRADSRIIKTVNALFDSVSEEHEHYELAVYANLYKLFYNLHISGYVHKKVARPADRGIHTVISILKWIETHNTEQITLERVSEVSGLSEKYLCRIFKEYTARTIMEYVNESRIERACGAMMTSSVTEAAFSSGFNDLSYFCKTFKKYKGMTPSEYKHRYLED